MLSSAHNNQTRPDPVFDSRSCTPASDDYLVPTKLFALNVETTNLFHHSKQKKNTVV